MKNKNYTPQGPSPARGKVNDIGMDLDENSYYKKPIKSKKLLRDQSSSNSDSDD
jgi:hypothetical protein